MSGRERFLTQSRERILLFDGAFGTEIQARKLTDADFAGDLGLSHEQNGNNDILPLTRPDVIAEITNAYLEAGSDIVSTNTFSANRISQADYGAEQLVAAINREAARIAREVADRTNPPMAGRGSLRARSGRPTRPCRFRPMSKIPDIARSTSTCWQIPTANRRRRWSRAARISFWSRRSSTRSTPRLRSMPCAGWRTGAGGTFRSCYR